MIRFLNVPLSGNRPKLGQRVESDTSKSDDQEAMNKHMLNSYKIFTFTLKAQRTELAIAK